jgi:hypothetical protein
LCAIWNIKPRLFDHDFVANPRNSGAIAVVCASSWPKIHRFYLLHQAHNTTLAQGRLRTCRFVSTTQQFVTPRPGALASSSVRSLAG